MCTPRQSKKSNFEEIFAGWGNWRTGVVNVASFRLCTKDDD